MTVDADVKRLILNYFSLYPTRLHVLWEIFIAGSGGARWATDDNGESYIKLHKDPEDGDEMRYVDSNTERALRDGNKPGIELENSLRKWVADNIDEYCQEGFVFSYTDLRPKKVWEFSYSDNLLVNIPEAIRKDWKDAALELCEYFMKLITPYGCTIGSKEALERVRHRDPDNAQLYLLLMNAQEKLLPKDGDKAYENLVEFGLIPSKEQMYMDAKEKLGIGEKLTFELYKLLTDAAIESSRIVYEGMGDIIESYFTTKEKYFTDKDKPNELLIADVDGVFDKCVNQRHMSVKSITGQILRKLDIDDFFKTQITHMVQDRYYQLVAAS